MVLGLGFGLRLGSGLRLGLGLGSHTHTHTAVLRPFVRVYPGEPVPEETFIHSHPSCSLGLGLGSVLELFVVVFSIKVNTVLFITNFAFSPFAFRALTLLVG